MCAAVAVCDLATGTQAAVFDLTDQTYNADATSRGAVARLLIAAAASAVPEPTFAALLGVGMPGLVSTRRLA